MARLSAECPHCVKTVAIRLSDDRLIVHSTPEGVECRGSDAVPPPLVAPDAPPPAKKKRGAKRKVQGKGGSVWTVSGGLPGLGKRS